jgi:hypothetical protein
MSDAEMFMEQARILRSLATTFEVDTMREDLLRLAKRCEDFALAKRAKDHTGPQSDSSG